MRSSASDIKVSIASSTPQSVAFKNPIENFKPRAALSFLLQAQSNIIIELNRGG